MADNVVVRSDPPSVALRLAELGLEEGTLSGAVLYGHQQASMLTRHDPALYRGLTPWAKTLRSLREQLAPGPYNWKSVNTHNYETVVNTLGTVAIAVATGDAATGLEDGNPSTTSAKGPETEKAVSGNQLSFVYYAATSDEAPDIRAQTWLLLQHHDREAKEIRIELSLPNRLDPQGYPADWLERVILQPISLEAPPLPERKVETIDIPVSRKTTDAG